MGEREAVHDTSTCTSHSSKSGEEAKNGKVYCQLTPKLNNFLSPFSSQAAVKQCISNRRASEQSIEQFIKDNHRKLNESIDNSSMVMMSQRMAIETSANDDVTHVQSASSLVLNPKRLSVPNEVSNLVKELQKTVITSRSWTNDDFATNTGGELNENLDHGKRFK